MRSGISECCHVGILVLVAVIIVALAYRWPELRLPIVSWLVSVTLLWRPSREKDT